MKKYLTSYFFSLIRHYIQRHGGISQFKQQHVNMQVDQGKSVTSLWNKELLHIPILNLRGICRITQGRYLLVKVFNVFSC